MAAPRRAFGGHRPAWPALVACLWTALLALAPVSLSAQANGDYLSLQQRVIELYAEHAAAIVRVNAVYAPRESGEKAQRIIGTGFFTSRDGHVLTNASVAYQADRVWVEHRNVEYAAEIIGADREANFSLLRVLTPPREFSILHLTDSDEIPPVGTVVVSLSKPLVFEPMPQLGLVTGADSRFGLNFFPCKYIRSSIPAFDGGGGAALIDLNGRLVGLMVGSLPEVQGSYWLPARAALRIRDDLYFNGRVTYSWIGFEIREEVSVDRGVRIILNEVLPETPAAEVGMQAGDVLTHIGEFPITDVGDVRNAMFYTRVGQYVRVRAEREGEALAFNVRMVERPADEARSVLVASPSPQPPEEVSPLTTPEEAAAPPAEPEAAEPSADQAPTASPTP